MSKQNRPVVYMWKDDTRIHALSADKQNPDWNRLENVCTILQSMVATGDVDALCQLIVEAVKVSEGLGESSYDMQNRIYHAIMKESVFNNGRLGY